MPAGVPEAAGEAPKACGPGVARDGAEALRSASACGAAAGTGVLVPRGGGGDALTLVDGARGDAAISGAWKGCPPAASAEVSTVGLGTMPEGAADGSDPGVAPLGPAC